MLTLLNHRYFITLPSQIIFALFLQWLTFCCGETRRNHLHILLCWFCCFTGFSFLEELLYHLLQNFCSLPRYFFMDMVFCHQSCKCMLIKTSNFSLSTLFNKFAKLSAVKSCIAQIALLK